MLLKKKKNIIIVLAISILIIGLLIGITIHDRMVIPKNSFEITENDSFCLSHPYNVNGVVGYKKTEFTQEEKFQILKFVASLNSEVTLKTEPDEELFGVPPKLTVYKQDYSIVFCLSSISNIEVRKKDEKGNVISRKKYETSARALKKMYILVGLPDVEPQE